jgi:uncharacterized membrane protein YsdA (DUF1294 family)
MPLTPLNLFYVMINLISFAAMGIDKRKSIRREWRISENILLGFALFGGAPGVIAGMLVFRHKTRKPLFYLGVPLIYLLHRALVMPAISEILIKAGFLW